MHRITRALRDLLRRGSRLERLVPVPESYVRTDPMEKWDRETAAGGWVRYRCRVCDRVTGSRNGMADHVRRKGHAPDVPARDPAPGP